jgi:hypothetical protein
MISSSFSWRLAMILLLFEFYECAQAQLFKPINLCTDRELRQNNCTLHAHTQLQMTDNIQTQRYEKLYFIYLIHFLLWKMACCQRTSLFSTSVKVNLIGKCDRLTFHE